MNKPVVYDLPTRLFHGLFAALFLTAFLIAKTAEGESPLFPYHSLAGLLLGFIVLFRLLWGLVGSKHARFASFSLHPRELVAYFTTLLSGERRRWVGHNPASSWATLLMLVFALGLGLTGYLMASGHKETYEDLHELLANGFLIVVLLHVAGVALHAMRHRDRILVTMWNGTKSGFPVSEAVEPHYRAGLLFLALVGGFGLHLTNQFDGARGTLTLWGAPLKLRGAESAEHEHGLKGEHPEREQDDDRDDDD